MSGVCAASGGGAPCCGGAGLEGGEGAGENRGTRSVPAFFPSLYDHQILTRTAQAVSKRKRTSISQREFSATKETSVLVPGSSHFSLSLLLLLTPRHTARGIRNLGNRLVHLLSLSRRISIDLPSFSSCYLSVVLQTFFVNPFLRAHYLADRHNRQACSKSRAGEPCLSCETDSLFAEVRLLFPFPLLRILNSLPVQQYISDASPLAPTKLLHSFWQSSAEAAGYAQQDAHEFLISSPCFSFLSASSRTDPSFRSSQPDPLFLPAPHRQPLPPLPLHRPPHFFWPAAVRGDVRTVRVQERDARTVLGPKSRYSGEEHGEDR